MATVYRGLSESLVLALVNFGLLAVAWVLVAAGTLRVVRSEIVIADTEP
jgi:hypothetical protein